MMRKLIFFLSLTLSTFLGSIEGTSVDLEEHIPDFVLYTKQLHIPGYPTAYNPSIIRWEGRLLMSFRLTASRTKKYDSEIGVVWVDENFNAVSNPQILDLSSPLDLEGGPSRAEDGRLVAVGETLYLVFDDNRDFVLSAGGFRMRVAELRIEGDEVTAKFVEPLLAFEGQKPTLREKGWTPFAYNGKLHLAYSLSPMRVFEYLPGTKSCKTIAETNPMIDWKWGILRGGTAAELVDGAYYLSFFHSSIPMHSVHSGGKGALHYFMGAYIFSPEPPFHLIGISPEPIIGKNFYHGKTYQPYHHPVCAVFPAGYVYNDETIFVVYGRQDHEMWVVAINKSGLFDSLKPVIF